MPNTCSAPLCRTGYPGEAKDPTTVFHRVPLKNKELMKKWITAIPRANYKPTIHSRLCSNHFVIEDYVSRRNEFDKTKNKIAKRSILKADAIPSVFTGIPKSCLKRIPKPRSNNASSSARLNKQRKKSMEDYQKFLDSDRVDSIRELLEKFDRRNIPSGIDEISRNNEMMFLSFDWENQEIRFSLKVQENLKIQLYHQTMQIPLSDVRHICKESKITATSQVGSLLSYLKSLTCSKKLIINKAVELLESVVLDQVSEVRHVDFIIEQLKLAFTTPKQRRYSQGLLTSCLQWKNCSPTLYKHLVKEDLICLPWPGHLTRLSQAFNLDTGIANSSRKYLLNRVPELTSNENKIIIDL